MWVLVTELCLYLASGTKAHNLRVGEDSKAVLLVV